MISSKLQVLPPSELMIGLVGAVGVDTDQVVAALDHSFSRFRWSVNCIRLSQLFSELDNTTPEGPLFDRYKALMDAGDRLRVRVGRGDAAALLGITKIADSRGTSGETEQPTSRTAYVFRSLKNPAEVQTLRNIYGANFVLLAAYAPRSIRLEHLALRLATSRHAAPTDEFRNQAEELIQRDERDAATGSGVGQNVRDTYPLADVFIDSSDPISMRASIDRFLDLLFGHPFHTPTKDEAAMFLAQASALRSADLGRQVGAVIATAEGDVIALGTNEVPKAGGGQYWSGEQPDERDFRRTYDANALHKQDIISNLLNILTRQELLSGVTYEDFVSHLEARKARLLNLIEFGRAVHAEMAAMMDAARRGVAVRGHTLYSTTFPCHQCARHIVAAGIKKVVYVEPYPKSLAYDLHSDSIDSPEMTRRPAGPDPVVMMPFVGIAPRLYMSLFAADDNRKVNGGVAAQWHAESAFPKGHAYLPPGQVQTQEVIAVHYFKELYLGNEPDRGGYEEEPGAAE